MTNNALKILQLATLNVLTEHSYGNNWSIGFMRGDSGNTVMTYLVESLAEIVRQKGIEQGIDAGAGIGHSMGHNLHDDAQQGGGSVQLQSSE